MNTNKLLLAALLASALGPVCAADIDEDQQQRVEERHVVRMGGMNGMEDAPMLAGPLVHMQHKLVKGAPYSAEMINERVQNLADGNQIASKSVAMSYRDGAGRTRQEHADAKGEVRNIIIHDPVAGTTVTLNPKDKTATRINIKEVAGEAREMARKQVEQMRKDGKLPGSDGKEVVTVQRSEGKDGEEIIIKRVERRDGDVRDRIREDVRVRVADAIGRDHGARLAELDNLGPMLAGAFGDMKWSGKATTKDLGSKDIDGTKAEGKLRSYEIPAGEMGNKNPIVVSDETWYSPELHLTLYSKHSDPRSGERIFRLGKLSRTEPAGALFAIPSDYTVKEAMANIKKTVIEKK